MNVTWNSKRQQSIYLGIIVAAALLYSGRNPQYNTGVFNDDAAYVLAAESVWDGNTVALQTLTHPRPDFPFPGLPYLLVPLIKVVEPHWILLEWLSVVISVLSVILLGLWLKTWLAPVETLTILALYALNPTVARLSGVMIPTPYFIVSIIASLFLVDELLKKSTPLKALALGLILGWGSLLRPEGVILLFSIPAALAIKRRWKDLALVFAIPTLFWVFFILQWIRKMHTGTLEYGGDLSALQIYWSQHAVEIFKFGFDFLQVLFMRTFLAFRWTGEGWTNAVSATIVIACMTIIGIGFRDLWKQNKEKRGIYVGIILLSAAYFAIHVLWHIAISRYCVVLLPFLLVFIVHGFRLALAHSPRRKIWIGMFAVLFIWSYGQRNVVALHDSLWAPNPLNSPPWNSIEWLTTHTAPSDNVLSPVAPSVILYARRPAMSLMKAANDEDFLYALAKTPIHYIVDRAVTALDTGVDKADDPNRIWDRERGWLRERPLNFPIVFEDSREKVTIYGVHPDKDFLEAYGKYLSAVQALTQNQPDKAVDLLRQSLALNPGSPSANNALGVVDYDMRTHLVEAERAFLKAIQVRPTFSIARLNLARLYYLTGKSEKSIEEVRTGLASSSIEKTKADFIQNILVSQDNRELDLPDADLKKIEKAALCKKS